MWLNTFKYNLFWLYVIGKRIRIRLSQWWWGSPPREPSEKEKIDQYLEKKTTRFLAKIDSITDTTPCTHGYNSNIESLFYDKETYKNILKEKTILSRWKSRFLLEPSPISSNTIIMRYDPVKMAFSYYSDTVISSYDLLNAISMKFVLQFHCLDFYVDESIWKDSKILNVLREEFIVDPKRPPSKNTEDSKEHSQDLEFIKENNNLFKKLKVNLKPPTHVKNPSTAVPSSIQELCKNRFVYLGRVRDFHPLNNPYRQKYTQRERSNLFPDIPDVGGEDEDVGDDPFTKREITMNWKEFKNRGTKV
jgi:hypothetical protein